MNTDLLYVAAIVALVVLGVPAVAALCAFVAAWEPPVPKEEEEN